jgi:hypothetical protein
VDCMRGGLGSGGSCVCLGTGNIGPACGLGLVELDVVCNGLDAFCFNSFFCNFELR